MANQSDRDYFSKMTTNCIKLRKGLFLVEWKLENLLSVRGETSLLFVHGAVSKAYTLKYRNDTKNSLLEITVLPKNLAKALKRSYHTAFSPIESSSSEDSISTFSSISDDEETFEINRENDSSEDQEIHPNLRDVLESRSADSDDELYEPYTDSDSIEETESDDHNEDLQDVDQENESSDDQIIDEDAKQRTAQGDNIYSHLFIFIYIVFFLIQNFNSLKVSVYSPSQCAVKIMTPKY